MFPRLIMLYRYHYDVRKASFFLTGILRILILETILTFPDKAAHTTLCRYSYVCIYVRLLFSMAKYSPDAGPRPIPTVVHLVYEYYPHVFAQVKYARNNTVHLNVHPLCRGKNAQTSRVKPLE